MDCVLVKAEAIDADRFDGELILMNLETRQVVVLNEAGDVLWSAIDSLPHRGALLELMSEAFPDRTADELGASLDSILEALLEGGFLREEKMAA